MLVIEGKSGKSRVLETYLKENTDKHDWDNRTVMIDYVKSPSMRGMTSHYCTSGFYHDTLEDMTVENLVEDYIKWHKSFDNYKTVVLYVNAPVDMIQEFKKLDEIYDQEFIVTIQNNDLENVKAYRV
jgi:PII-like signaling protein